MVAAAEQCGDGGGAEDGDSPDPPSHARVPPAAALLGGEGAWTGVAPLYRMAYSRPRMQTEERILREFRRIAVVGLSDDPSRPSFGVARYMQAHGYTVVPVNPRLTIWEGERAYPDLASVPPPLEVVDVFRRSDAVASVVDDAIRAGARAIWLQEGVIDESAARRAEEAGLLVVRDRCMLKEHRSRCHLPPAGREERRR